jgi:DNA-binding transcriptional ArsR family regulator
MARTGNAASHAPVCDVLALNQSVIRKARKHAIGATGAARLAATFRMLANPTRVRILDALGRSELCVCDLAALLQARISAVSHQLALLRRHTLVRWRREGKLVYYSLDDRHVRTLLAQARAHAEHPARPGRPPAGKTVAEPGRSRGGPRRTA